MVAVTKKDKHICSNCKEHRVIVSDLVVCAHIMTNDGTNQWRQTELTMRYALCRGCNARLAGVNSTPTIHLSSGGIRKRLTPRQEAILARKRAKAARQLEMDLYNRDDIE